MKSTLKNLALLSTLLMPLALASCTPGGGDTEEKTTVVKMSLMNSTNENPGWFAMIDKANEVLEKRGEKIKIEVDLIMTDEWDKYYAKIASNMAGRVGGTIGRIAESHIPMMIKKNQLQDLTPVYNKLDMSLYNEEAFKGVSYSNDKYYGLPTGIQHMVLYYNKDIFDKYNENKEEKDKVPYPSGDWDNPSTFDEIRDIAAKLSAGVRPNRQFGLSAGPFLAYGGMYAKSLGGYNIFDENGNSAIKSDEYYTVYDWFDKMIKEDESMPKPTDTTIETAMNQFQSGNIAMCIDGAWWLNDLTNEKLVDFNVGIAAVPTGIKGHQSYSSQFTDCFFAVRGSRTAEADLKAIEALMSVEAINEVAKKGVGGIPVLKSASETYVSSFEGKFTKEDTMSFVEGAKHGLHVPYTTYYNEVDQIINQKMTLWLNGQMSSKEFVDFMHNTLQSKIDANR